MALQAPKWQLPSTSSFPGSRRGVRHRFPWVWLELSSSCHSLWRGGRREGKRNPVRNRNEEWNWLLIQSTQHQSHGGNMNKWAFGNSLPSPKPRSHSSRLPLSNWAGRSWERTGPGGAEEAMSRSFRAFEVRIQLLCEADSEWRKCKSRGTSRVQRTPGPPIVTAWLP